jgi:hypothetical protein
VVVAIKQQVITVQGKVLGVATDNVCPTCGAGYVELRRQDVKISRSGVPAPFGAPTWGEARRKQELAAELQRVVAAYEEVGLPREAGAARCPACRRGIRPGPDPTFAPARLWVLVASVVGFLCAVGVFAATINTSSGTHAEATDAALLAAGATFLMAVAVGVGLAIHRGHLANQAMHRPSDVPPVDAVSPADWAVINQDAERIEAPAAAHWFARTEYGVGPPVSRNEDLWRERVDATLESYRVLWVVTTRSAANP